MAISGIIPNLWFDSEAEDAARFYTSIFKNSKIGDITRYPEAATEVSGKPAGSVLTVSFTINGMEFVALNGGPEFKFSEAVSFAMECDTQAEIDELWSKLTADGGEESACGWLKDRFGLSWQIVPRTLTDMLSDPDPAKSTRVMRAMLEMQKIDVPTLERAYAAD